MIAMTVGGKTAELKFDFNRNIKARKHDAVSCKTFFAELHDEAPNKQIKPHRPWR